MCKSLMYAWAGKQCGVGRGMVGSHATLIQGERTDPRGGSAVGTRTTPNTPRVQRGAHEEELRFYTCPIARDPTTFRGFTIHSGPIHNPSKAGVG